MKVESSSNIELFFFLFIFSISYYVAIISPPFPFSSVTPCLSLCRPSLLSLSHSFSFVCVSLSVNPRAVGFVEVVFPHSDKGLYKMSLTLEGS